MSTEQQEVGHILIHDQPTLPSRIPFSIGDFIIGRSSTKSTIILKENSISQKHARLVVTPQFITITDLGSKNGTKIDTPDNELPKDHPTIIDSGTVIYFADIKCTFVRTEDPEPVSDSPQIVKFNSKSKERVEKAVEEEG